MRFDGVLVESVYLRSLGGASCGGDVACHPVERVPRAPGQEDLRSLTRERARNGAADRTTASVDHSSLVVQKHLILLSVQSLAGSVAPRTRRCA